MDFYALTACMYSVRRRQWQPTPVLLPGKSHGCRSLVGCSRGVAKSRTRLINFTFTFHFHALEKEMANHSSVLARRIPGMGEAGGLPSMGSHRVGHDWSDLAATTCTLLLLYYMSHDSDSGNVLFLFCICFPYSFQHFTVNHKEQTLSYIYIWKVKVKSPSCVQFFATPWTVAYQVPPSLGFSRQEYWSGLPFPSPGDLPDPGIEPGSPTL